MLRMMQLITKNALIRPPGALNQWTQPILAQQGARIYVRSLNLKDGILYFIGVEESEKSLYLASEKSFASPFRGDESHDGGLYLLKAELSAENASLLHHFFPFTQPRSLRNERTTIGCGDRLGLATPGHLRAIEGYDAFPVLAQQSIRELTLTGRGYDRVVADATFLVFQEGYTRGYGADGDHLKTIKDIDVALAAKMPMITLDLTDFLAPRAAEMSAAKVDEVFEQVDPHLKAYIHENYEGKTFNVRGAAFVLDRTEARRCALMYWRALDFSRDVDRHLKEKIGSDYDLEISIDETTTPTLPSHHLFIARELLARHVIVNSLAPRFIGEFQKAIDYRGDIREFDKQLAEHCLIAKEHGNYKISIHSGSDKYSVFPGHWEAHGDAFASEDLGDELARSDPCRFTNRSRSFSEDARESKNAFRRSPALVSRHNES